MMIMMIRMMIDGDYMLMHIMVTNCLALTNKV